MEFPKILPIFTYYEFICLDNTKNILKNLAMLVQTRGPFGKTKKWSLKRSTVQRTYQRFNFVKRTQAVHGSWNVEMMIQVRPESLTKGVLPSSARRYQVKLMSKCKC